MDTEAEAEAETEVEMEGEPDAVTVVEVDRGCSKVTSGSKDSSAINSASWVSTGSKLGSSDLKSAIGVKGSTH